MNRDELTHQLLEREGSESLTVNEFIYIEFHFDKKFKWFYQIDWLAFNYIYDFIVRRFDSFDF